VTLRKTSINVKLLLGLIISVCFMFLALKNIKFTEISNALREANYWFLIPAIAVLLLSHWLRAIRWRYFMLPLAKVRPALLFSATMIGYMGNVILPAHLGEFFRAYVVSKKQKILMSSTFATIVLERIIDLWSMLLIMAITFIIYPFPDWVTKSGYITFVFAVGLVIVLILMKKKLALTLRIIRFCLKPLPESIVQKVQNLITSFLNGLVPLKHWIHYAIVTFYSAIIWACYAGVFYLVFHAFGFVSTYQLTWITSLVLLVVTTISVIVPSAPGYIGTYHWLCQLSLGFFGVPKATALTYAFLVHGVFFLPVLFIGLVYLWVEGLTIASLYDRANLTPAADAVSDT